MTARRPHPALALALAALTALAPTLAAPRRAAAETEEERLKRAEELYSEGDKLYNLAEYDKAIEKFKEAYLLSKEPLLLYNIAQAYRQKGDCANALKFYKNYLREAPDAENKETVDKRVVEMDECVKKAQSGEPRPVDHTETTPDPKPDSRPPPVERPAPRGGGKKLAGLVTAGVGVVLVGTGVYFSSVAAGKAGDIEDECAMGCDFANPDIAALDEEGKAAERNAIVLYAVGGVAVAGGVGLWLWGRSEARASQRPSMAVVPARGGGAVVTWAFDF
jgi:tetratricopeptide (TPR) repeat protein